MKYFLFMLIAFITSCGGGESSSSTASSPTTSGSQAAVCLENYMRIACTSLKSSNSTVTINPAGSCNNLIPNPAVVISGANLNLPPTDPQWTKYPQIQVYSGATDPVSCYFVAQ
jgi:hypothetical protein